MISTLLDLTVRGSIVFSIVWIGDTLLAPHMQARSRRAWWVLIPIAFLLPIKAPILPSQVSAQTLAPGGSALDLPLIGAVTAPAGTPTRRWESADVVAAVWIGGVIVSLTVLAIQTMRMSRRWAVKRFSTDVRLLEIVEDCKKLAGVSAPIGLIVSEEVEAPAIVGWLRPRILLPLSLTTSLEDQRIRHVILHELAHFRFLDVPTGWLFAAMCSAHWFNPLAYFASRKWSVYREEAADENVLRWSAGESPGAYGETLLALIRAKSTPSSPGLLAIGETFHNLKHRIHMIKKHVTRTQKSIFAAALTGVLVVVAMAGTQPDGDAKAAPEKPADTPEQAVKAAVPAMEQWLKTIDAGQYAKSWDEAAKTFQNALSSEKWAAALTSVRTPLGTVNSRKLASATNQKGIPTPSGGMLKGDYVIAQFHTSFANLDSAVETVTFELQDGAWKASGYFIRPR
jgi:beta-lactamase regulating signal transducer with metallopeptidase domain